MRLILVLIILILMNAVNVYSSIIINEIMYSPDSAIQCSDSFCEYIEVYNPTNNPIDLNNWKFCNDSLLSGYINNTGRANPPVIKNTTTIIQPNAYAIITDGGSGTKVYNFFNVNENSIAFHVDKSDLCNNGLSNSGELTFISDDNGSLISSVNYSNSLGQGKGKSLQKINADWCYADPTPGTNNKCDQDNSTSLNKLMSINNLPKSIDGNGTPINLLINFIKFDNGSYDLKLDIKNINNETIGRVYNGIEEEWQSSNNYINNAFFINENNLNYNVLIKIDETKKYSENALLQVKLRKSGSTTIIAKSNMYNININQPSESSINKVDQPYIKIINLPEDIRFGDYVNIDVEVYRGNSSRQVVYFYFEDKDKKKISNTGKVYVKSKFSLNESTISLQLKCKNEEGGYKLIGEGLNIDIKKDLKLFKCDTNNSNLNNNQEQIYQIEFQERIKIEEEFKTKISIKNKDNIPKVFTAWSYVYKGSKCYSCFNSREENAEQIEIEPNSIGDLELNNIVESASEGAYKLKVKILKENLKIPKEFTYDINIDKIEIHSQEAETDSSFLAISDKNFDVENKISGNVAYESTDIKIKDKSIYIIVIVLSVIIIFVLFRKGL